MSEAVRSREIIWRTSSRVTGSHVLIVRRMRDLADVGAASPPPSAIVIVKSKSSLDGFLRG